MDSTSCKYTDSSDPHEPLVLAHPCHVDPDIYEHVLVYCYLRGMSEHLLSGASYTETGSSCPTLLL